MEYRQLFKNGKLLMYKLMFKNNIKNINGKVDKNNEIIVTAPIGINLKSVDQFVLKYFEKFINFIKQQEEKSLINLKQNFIYIKGIKYNIITKYVNTRQKYEIIANKIYLFLKDDSNKKKMIAKMLDEIGSEYIIKKAKIIAKKAGFDVSGGFSTKWYNTKWGQCEIKSKKITLATQLIMFNDEIIDYVIIHELCHLIHADHSNQFWKLVEQYYPNYKWAREKLKFQV